MRMKYQYNRRFSGNNYQKSTEEIEAIKKKYSKGVPVSEIKKMVYGV